MDESTLLVREYAAQSKSKTKKSQLWVMSSGWGSPYKAQWFTVTNNRSAQTVIDVFDNPEIQNDKNKLKVEYLTTDGYVGYTKAIKVLKEHGINITSTRCLCHARRPLHRYPLGDTIVCDELVKAIEGVTTNGKTKLQQG